MDSGLNFTNLEIFMVIFSDKGYCFKNKLWIWDNLILYLYLFNKYSDIFFSR